MKGKESFQKSPEEKKNLNPKRNRGKEERFPSGEGEKGKGSCAESDSSEEEERGGGREGRWRRVQGGRGGGKEIPIWILTEKEEKNADLV